MTMNKYILSLVLLLGAAIGFSSCSSDEPNSTSIFNTTEAAVDTASATYQFDSWLYTNYVQVYNLDFRYKMQDVGADMDYNLVPAEYDKAVDLAVLSKYLWFDVYKGVVGIDFLKSYGPRIIHLIGSPAYNAANGTMILGLAEGGLKVSLFRVNYLDVNDFLSLNEYYFKTMHHEFAHILHQTKTYPKEFNLLSVGNYEPFKWQERDEKVVASLGFTSPYASSETREDFAETVANYITKTDAQWAQILDWASKNWTLQESSTNVYVEGGESDGVDGKAVILQKVSIVRQWFKDSWGVDLDSLRSVVQYRQSHFNIDSLRNEVYSIKK